MAGIVATNFFDQNFSSILNGVALGMLIFILAIGLSLIFGLLDVLNLAHGSLYLLGTYLGYTLVEHHGVPFIPAALITIVFGVALGFVLAVALIPVRDRGHLDQVLLTLGLFFIVGFFAMPAHAPFASGMVASATPAAPAPLRNLRRSSDPVVLSSFTLPPSVRFTPPDLP